MAEEKVVKKKKKKRRKKNYVLRLLIVILLGTGLYFLLSAEFFDIQSLTVENNSYYTSEQIIEMTGARTGANIFFETNTGKMKETLLADPYIKNASIKRELPDALNIYVEERKESAAVKYGDIYILTDVSGLVLRKTEVEPKVTLLVGLTLRTIEPGKALAAEENYALSDTLEVIKSMEESEIFFKKIDISNVMLKAYIYDQLICSGTPEAIKKNLENGGLEKVLFELYNQGIERGVISVNSDGSCAFNAAIE